MKMNHVHLYLSFCVNQFCWHSVHPPPPPPPLSARGRWGVEHPTKFLKSGWGFDKISILKGGLNRLEEFFFIGEKLTKNGQKHEQI